jgi:LEA14-like dessication related protein
MTTQQPLRSLLLAALVLLGAILAGGCELFGSKWQTPHLAVIKVDMVDSNVLSQRFRIRVRAQNPNARALPVRAITCRLELAGEEFGNGVSGEQFVVPAYGEAEFDMLLTTNLAGALLRIAGRKDHGQSLDYRLSGKIDLAKGLWRSIPFSDSGSLPVAGGN